MGRKKSELSPIQRKPELFSKVQAEIRYFSVEYLSTLGKVSHTTLHLFLKGKPVSDKSNREIKEVLKKARLLKEQATQADLADYEQLVEQDELVEQDG